MHFAPFMLGDPAQLLAPADEARYRRAEARQRDGQFVLRRLTP